MNDNNSARRGANKWYGQFTFDQVEKIRAKAQDDLTVQADITTATGNNMDLTQMILGGPNEDMIAALKEADDTDPIHQDFDNVWGQGAAEHYRTLEQPHGFWEHISELPGAATRGLFGAAAEFGENVFNTRGEAQVEALEAKNAYDAYLATKRGEQAGPYHPLQVRNDLNLSQNFWRVAMKSFVYPEDSEGRKALASVGVAVIPEALQRLKSGKVRINSLFLKDGAGSG